jgi:hypothetical protein
VTSKKLIKGSCWLGISVWRGNAPLPTQSHDRLHKVIRMRNGQLQCQVL